MACGSPRFHGSAITAGGSSTRARDYSSVRPAGAAKKERGIAAVSRTQDSRPWATVLRPGRG